MSSVPERAHDLLEHIVEALDRIDRYTESSEQRFLGDEMIQDAVVRNLEIIGEASRSIERRFPEFASRHPDLPLRSAYEMRNVLSHGYFKVDLAIVWATVARDLPKLREKIDTILR